MSSADDSFYLGGYWGPRSESADECARRLFDFLCILRDVHPLLASWYKTGASRSEALSHQIDPSIDAVKQLLIDGQNHRDDENRTTIANLGFSVDLWNGEEPEAAIMTHCGSWAVLAGPASNNVVVDLPDPEGEGLTLYNRETALALIRATVTVWQPSWCSWTSRRLRKAQGVQRGEGVVGWSTYVAHPDRIQTNTLPADVSVQSLEGGLLLTVTGDANLASDESVSMLRAALGSATQWNDSERT